MPTSESPLAVGRHAQPRLSWFRIPPQGTVPAAEQESAATFALANRVRTVGYAVLAVQLIGFCAWSALLYHRYALTWDFAVYNQPWYLIAHGHLDPSISIESMPFWRNDAEFAIWPLAIFYWLGPHGLTLLWLQDIGVVAAEAVAFGWMCSLAARSRSDRTAAWVISTGLLLFVVSPWLWWSISFDFHMESVALPFAVLLARDLANGQPIRAAKVPVYLGQVIYAQGGTQPSQAFINNSYEGQTPVEALTNAQGVAVFTITSTVVNNDPVYFEANLVKNNSAYPYGYSPILAVRFHK